MERTAPPNQHVRPLANAAGISVEATDLAVDMTRVAARSPDMANRLPKAIAAGCLYTAALAVGSGRNGGLRFERGGRPSGSASAPRTKHEESGPTMKRNTQVHHRTDHESTELSICEFASITPASLRRYAREVAAIYLESDNASPHVRARLGRLPLR